MTIVAIATINGLIMHRKLFLLFEQCAQEKIPLLSKIFSRHAWLLVSAGSISTISWYAALVLGTWRSLTLSYLGIMSWYLDLLALVVMMANVAVCIFLKDPAALLQSVSTLTQLPGRRLGWLKKSSSA